MALGRQELTDITKEQAETSPGMAHFAGTGPKYTWCNDCTHLITDRGATFCGKYEKMMGKRGRAISTSNKSCRHYSGPIPEEKPKPQRRKQGIK